MKILEDGVLAFRRRILDDFKEFAEEYSNKFQKNQDAYGNCWLSG